MIEETAEIQYAHQSETEGETPPDAYGTTVQDDTEQVTERYGYKAEADERVFQQFLHIAYTTKGIYVARLHAVANLVEYHGPYHGYHGGGDGGKKDGVVVGNENTGYLPAEDEYQRCGHNTNCNHQMIAGMGREAYASPSPKTMIMSHTDGHGGTDAYVEHVYKRGDLPPNLMGRQGGGGIPRYTPTTKCEGYARERRQLYGQLQGYGPSQTVVGEKRLACYDRRFP